MSTDSICTIFGHSKVTPVSWRRSLYQSGASATTRWQRYQCVPKHWAGSSKFVLFLEPSFNQRLSQANFIFFVFSSETLLGYVKHAKLRCFLQRHIQPQSWNSHPMLTVIDIWDESCNYLNSLYTSCRSSLTTFNQTTHVVTELHKIQNDTQYVLLNLQYYMANKELSSFTSSNGIFFLLCTL